MWVLRKSDQTIIQVYEMIFLRDDDDDDDDDDCKSDSTKQVHKRQSKQFCITSKELLQDLL
jgi:hypothetical protein